MDSRREAQIPDAVVTQAEGSYLSSWILLPLAALLGSPGGYAFVEFDRSRVLIWLLPFACIMVAIIGGHLRSAWQILLFALAYSLGATAYPLIDSFLNPDWLWDSRGASALCAVHISINSAVCVGVWWLLWGRPRRAKAKRRFLCDNCSYSLIGNTSGVCPECGTPIAFGAKGITPEQLKMLARPDRPAAGDTP